MKPIQNGQMSHEQVRKMFNDWRSQLDKLEELVMEEALMQGARWEVQGTERGYGESSSAHTLSITDGTACCGRVGSRHFQKP